MAEATGPISSAVIFPEPEIPHSPRTKRRQSSGSETAAKRPRLSEDGSAQSPSTLRASPQATDSIKREPSVKVEPDEIPTQPNQDRRKSSVQEEKKRGQRLFGGLLSTLSQSTPNGQQKRRLEIEKRQADRAKQQKLDDEARKAEKIAKLKEIRKAEQIKFDEQSMRIRHSNMLAMANFLCTKSQPKIYYKPWEILPSEADRIKEQIAEAEAFIEREVTEFEKRYPKIDAISERENTNTSKETVGEPQAEPTSVSNVSIDTTNPPVQEPRSERVTTERTTPEENNGEVVVEAEEDTVIY